MATNPIRDQGLGCEDKSTEAPPFASEHFLLFLSYLVLSVNVLTLGQQLTSLSNKLCGRQFSVV